MRGLTSTIVLLVILAGLGGYLYFGGAPNDTADAKPKAFDVSPENIEEVIITTAEGGTVRAQRVDANWKVVEPEETPADAGEIASITSSLASLDIQRVVDEQASNVAQYGLEPAKVDVAFRVKDSKEFRRLLVGERTPTGGDVYAKLPDEPRVFLISSYLENIFNKTPFNLRDKKILAFDRDKADVVEIEGGTPMQFNRGGTEWRMTKPISARADYASIEGLVTQLATAQMQASIAKQADDLRQYGLDRPPMRVSVGSGSARATLLVGTPSPEGAPYAKDSARPEIFTIAQSLITELSKPLDDYRRKDVFDFRSFNATRVEVTRDGATQTFVRNTADGKDVWKDDSGKTLEFTKVDALMGHLTGLRAQSFEGANAALKTPALTVTATFDEGKRKESVTFGRSGTDVYASRSDEPGAAKLEAGTTFDDAIKALDELK